MTPSKPAVVPVDFDREPSSYKHWALTFDGDGRHADHAGPTRRRPARRLRAQAELLRPRGRHRAARRGPAAALRAPRGARRSWSRAGSRRCSAPAPTSRCSRPRATPSRSTSASSRTRRATRSRTRREHSGQVWLAAVNGTAAGGGYELALACDEIVLVDDRSTRGVAARGAAARRASRAPAGSRALVDKRHVRRDLADVFATRTEGVRGQQALRVGSRRRARAAQPVRPRVARARHGARRGVGPAVRRAGRRADAA